MKSERVTVRFSPEQIVKLELDAQRFGITVSDLVRARALLIAPDRKYLRQPVSSR